MNRKYLYVGGHKLPVDVLDQHILVLGKTRSGKSSVMRVFVEDLLTHENPVCVIDPKGDWWGLKSSADGKHPGFPVVIFGGEHADVPINEHSGGHVAELIAEANRPCIIDLGGWMPGARTRFFIAFASSLFVNSRGKRWVVMDEVHNFAPQLGGRAMGADQALMVHWANRLASEGLGRGIHLIAASQRPQKVAKDFVTSAETLIAMRVIHKLDRDAIKEWIDGCGDPVPGKRVLAELAGMKRGEGFLWSPECDFGPERIAFPLFSTYDSFRPRTGAESSQLEGWANVDLDEVTERLSAVVKEAEENDPKMLKRRIQELTLALNQQKATTIPNDREQELETRLASQGETILGLRATIRDLVAGLHPIEEAVTNLLARGSNVLANTFDPVPPKKSNGITPQLRHRQRKEQHETPNLDIDITGPMQRILNAIAFLESVGNAEPDNAAVAFIAGYTSCTGGAFVNPRGKLNTIGLIEYSNGKMRLTENGRAIAAPPESILSNDDLHKIVLKNLRSGPMERLLRPLLDKYPSELTNEELAEAAGYGSFTGGAFVNPRGRLNTLGLIEYRNGRARASDNLFPFGAD